MDFNSIIDFFKNLPDTIKNAPNDEKAAYGAVGAGILCAIMGIVLIIIA